MHVPKLHNPAPIFQIRRCNYFFSREVEELGFEVVSFPLWLGTKGHRLIGGMHVCPLVLEKEDHAFLHRILKSIRMAMETFELLTSLPINLSVTLV